MDDFTQKQTKTYIKQGGTYCPYCGSDDLLTGDLDDQGYSEISRDVHCCDCKENWIEGFEMTEVHT